MSFDVQTMLDPAKVVIEQMPDEGVGIIKVLNIFNNLFLSDLFKREFGM